MISELREAKLLGNRKVKIRFLPGAKAEDLMFHLIPYLYKEPGNIIINIGTNDGPDSNENAIYVKIKKIKELIRTIYYPNVRSRISPSRSYVWIIKKLPMY